MPPPALALTLALAPAAAPAPADTPETVTHNLARGRWRVDWRAPGECVDPGEDLRLLDQELAPRAGIRPRITITVTIDPAADEPEAVERIEPLEEMEGMLASLVIRRGAAEERHQLWATDCTAVTEAVLVVLDNLIPPPRAEPPRRERSRRRGQPSDLRLLGSVERLFDLPSGPRGARDLTGGATTGGLLVALGWTWPRLRLELGPSLRLGQMRHRLAATDESAATPGLTLDSDWIVIAGRAATCARIAGDTLRLGGCAGLELGAALARVPGARGSFAPAATRASAPWFAASLGPAIRWRFLGNFALWGAAEGVFAAHSPFYVETEGGATGRLAAPSLGLGLRGAVGLEFHWGERP